MIGQSNLYKRMRIYPLNRVISYGLVEIKLTFYNQLILHSFSQNKEDLQIEKLLGKKRGGFYVDVGANNPHRFSNTKRFYLKNWKGINIEANPIKLNEFRAERKRDINLNIGIANKKGRLNFYRFTPDTVSTFSKIESEKSQKRGYILEQVTKIEVNTLENILDKYIDVKYIDFLSIDTEGYDTEVLLSNNWQKYRPKLICIESLARFKDGKDLIKQQDEILQSNGYSKVADNGSNSFYIDKKIRSI
jgi:FkbM family methyltransferase